ncbi:MAG: 5-(carboxyamino)imidazole ribonucleotide synthase [Chloroflexota bacterium]|nr:MAG: 5-(carboxyamino)imidazole ribonucleotide synthase [Chloroflexota bacterium]
MSIRKSQTVGVLGAGQLGRMLALAGYPLGIHFSFLDPSGGAPAAELAPVMHAPYDDEEALVRLASSVDVVTYEIEALPLKAVESLAQSVPVCPATSALAVAQDRLEEKRLCERLDIPVVPWHPVASPEEAAEALTNLPGPLLLKRRRGGYDGRGQSLFDDTVSVEDAWRALGNEPMIVESVVDFQRELSLIAVRGFDGVRATYPLVENHHRDGILRLSLAPAPRVTDGVQRTAEIYADRLLQHLDYVGVLTIEFFEVAGELMLNEMAPRVHNSGHWTIEGAETSQFENHLRAILQLPLGSTDARCPCAMVNLVGDIPLLAPVLHVQGASVHLYGKESRPARKLGHVTVRGRNWEQVWDRLQKTGLAIQPDELRACEAVGVEWP